MSTQGLDYSSSGEWLRDDGPDRDVVISSRVRLARNLAGFNFINRAERAERQQLVEMAREQTAPLRDDRNLTWIDLLDVESLERSLLVERHLISKQLAKGDDPRALIVCPDESIAVMVNEEDHFRIQSICSGLRLREAYDRVNEIDNRLEEKFPFAYHKRFGYLTACPTNVGTGIRVSVMLHLPALTLTNEIERVRRAARDMQLAIRGFFGEGSDALGDFYQISNQTTFGKSEAELLEDFDKQVIPQVINYERQARRMLVDKRNTVLDDRCFRALGILKNARLIKVDEAMRLLSHVRLGVETRRIEHVTTQTVNRLMLLCHSAHLQHCTGKTLHQGERGAARAELIRSRLAEG